MNVYKKPNDNEGEFDEQSMDRILRQILRSDSSNKDFVGTMVEITGSKGRVIDGNCHPIQLNKQSPPWKTRIVFGWVGVSAALIILSASFFYVSNRDGKFIHTKSGIELGKQTEQSAKPANGEIEAKQHTEQSKQIEYQKVGKDDLANAQELTGFDPMDPPKIDKLWPNDSAKPVITTNRMPRVMQTNEGELVENSNDSGTEFLAASSVEIEPPALLLQRYSIRVADLIPANRDAWRMWIFSNGYFKNRVEINGKTIIEKIDLHNLEAALKNLDEPVRKALEVTSGKLTQAELVIKFEDQRLGTVFDLDSFNISIFQPAIHLTSEFAKSFGLKSSNFPRNKQHLLRKFFDRAVPATEQAIYRSRSPFTRGGGALFVEYAQWEHFFDVDKLQHLPDEKLREQLQLSARPVELFPNFAKFRDFKSMLSNYRTNELLLSERGRQQMLSETIGFDRMDNSANITLKSMEPLDSMVAGRKDLQGLPLVMGTDCQMSPQEAG
ncbi:MAG: hypothetical protein AAGA30_20805, partial [Planctomycetota bacterium]